MFFYIQSAKKWKNRNCIIAGPQENFLKVLNIYISLMNLILSYIYTLKNYIKRVIRIILHLVFIHIYMNMYTYIHICSKEYIYIYIYICSYALRRGTYLFLLSQAIGKVDSLASVGKEKTLNLKSEEYC